MIINVLIDEEKIIRGYATVGSIKGGISVNADYSSLEDVPPLSIGYYKLIDGKIVVDENLKAEYEATA